LSTTWWGAAVGDRSVDLAKGEVILRKIQRNKKNRPENKRGLKGEIVLLEKGTINLFIVEELKALQAP